MARRRNSESGSPGDGRRRSVDWRRELDRLKLFIDATRPVEGYRIRHAVLRIEGGLPDRIGRIHPRLYAGGARVHRVIPVPLPAGGHLVHFFLDDEPEGDAGDELTSLARVVRNTRRLLLGLPQRLLPPFTLPAVADGRDEELLTWVSLLHWLGHLDGNAAFRGKLEYLADEAEFFTSATFTDWDRCYTLPEFDPLPYLTGTPAGSKTLAEWKAEHAAGGRRLPGVIASSLGKPLWQASANAVDQILLLDLRQTRAGTPGPTGARRPKGPPKRKDDANRERMSRLIAALYAHHRPTDPERCDTELDQREIAKLAGVSASTVSRRLAHLMQQVPGCQGKEPMAAYRDLCNDDGRIHEELVRLRIKYVDENLPRLFTRGNMDRFAGDSKPAPRGDEEAEG